MDDHTDADLLRRWCSGDREAYAVLVSRHFGVVRAACDRQAASGDGDDCTQAVFLILARRPMSASRAPVLIAWLLRVAWYVCCRSHRAARRRRMAERAAGNEVRTQSPVRSEALEHLDECLMDLPERQRAAVSMHYLSGKTPDEIAVTLGTSRENTYQLLSRGLTALRTLLTRRGVSISGASLASLMLSEVHAANAPASASMLTAISGTPSLAAGSLAAGATTSLTIAAVAPFALVAGLIVSLSVGAITIIHQLELRPVETVAAPPDVGSVDSVTDRSVQSQVTQYGITWTFAQPVRVGRFITGDWYVVGPATVQQIEPAPIIEFTSEGGEGETAEPTHSNVMVRHGSSLNPPVQVGRCGFDDRIEQGFDLRLATQLPIPLHPGDTLISTISNGDKQERSEKFLPVRVGAILTCVAAPAPSDAFRPAYAGGSSGAYHLARNVRRDALLRLPRPGSGAPAHLHQYADLFQKPWIELARFGMASPQQNMPGSGSTFAEQVGEATLLLLCDYPAAEKESVLIGLVQIGIDYYGLAQAGATWPAHGSNHVGRKWPIMFAGIMLNDRGMQTPDVGIPEVRFSEDEQTAFGPLHYRGRTFNTSWSGAKAIFLGQEIDKTHSTSEVEANWNEGHGMLDVYPPSEWPTTMRELRDMGRATQAGAAWVAEALAARIMHAEQDWGHDAFFAYVDRWMTEEVSAFDEPQVEAQPQKNSSVKRGRQLRQGYVWGQPWVSEMWAMYRERIPPAPGASTTPSAQTTWK